MYSDISDDEDDGSYSSRVALPEVPLPRLEGLWVELFISVGIDSEEEPLFGYFLFPRNEDLLAGGIGRFDATELELGLLIASPCSSMFRL